MVKSNHHLILIVSAVIVVGIIGTVAVIRLTKPSPCVSTICSDNKYVKGKVAAGKMCKSHTCVASDAAVCCIPKGNCSSGGKCTDKTKTQWNKASKLCASRACTAGECCRKPESKVDKAEKGADAVMREVVKATNSKCPDDAFKGKSTGVAGYAADLECLSDINIPENTQQIADDIAKAVKDSGVCPKADSKKIKSILDQLTPAAKRKAGWKLALAGDIMSFKCS